ncbi:ABC transporter ATP-binding protein [Vibrio hippocampi]|uniref:ABC transporter ATP-binding protein n=1 Tax=Vibrio hippocampi TaxID=654686 RepID=UPI001F488CF0|nr:dipeptide/oligopeptide/nickel ABC transporter ATP-binding protein [Vibrio hippocampi]
MTQVHRQTSQTHSSAQIAFNDVSVHYYTKPRWMGGQPFKALQQLSLTLNTQSLAIVGPSGAGKSTLIELLFGLRQPTSGQITICGYNVAELTNTQRVALCQHIQLIPQEPHASLNPYYTVRQVLSEPLISLGKSEVADSRLQQALEDVGLDIQLLERNSKQLSVGQAQRVAIARALVVDPCILVADEPTSSLDPVNRKMILQLLGELQRKRNMKLMLVTHDLDAAQQLCDEILVLDNGQKVEHLDSDKFLTDCHHHTTLALLRAKDSHQYTRHQYTLTHGEVTNAI